MMYSLIVDIYIDCKIILFSHYLCEIISEIIYF